MAVRAGALQAGRQTGPTIVDTRHLILPGPTPAQTHPGSGVVSVSAAEAAVGVPAALTPVAVTAYVVPGPSPAKLHSVLGQCLTTAGPPPVGVAVTVYGPVTAPPGGGETVAVAVLGPVGLALTAGAPAGGVATDSAGEGGVARPLAAVAVAVMLYVWPGTRPSSGQAGEAHVFVTVAPPPTGVAVTLKGPAAGTGG